MRTEITYRLRLNPHLVTICHAQNDWERLFGTERMTLAVEVDDTAEADGCHFIARVSFPTANDAMLFKLGFTAPIDSPMYARSSNLL